MKIDLIICLLFLIVDQILTDVAKTTKNKSKKPKEILEEITTALEKCAAKSNKNENKKIISPSLKKCLSGMKAQKNFLNKKDKSTKDIFKKVVTKLFKCLKPSSKGKKSKKNQRSNSIGERVAERRRRARTPVLYVPNVPLDMIFDELTFSEFMRSFIVGEVCVGLRNFAINRFNRSPWNIVSFGRIQQFLNNQYVINAINNM